MDLKNFLSRALPRIRETLPESMTCQGEVWQEREPHRRTGVQVEVSKSGGGGAKIQMAQSTFPFEQLATFSIVLPGTGSCRYAIVATRKGNRAAWFLSGATYEQVFRRDGTPAPNRYTIVDLRHSHTKRVDMARAADGIPFEPTPKVHALLDEMAQAAVASLLLKRKLKEEQEDESAAMKRREAQTEYMVAGCGLLLILAVLGGVGLICAG